MTKKVLITGAAIGIGAEVVRELANDNTMILHYCNSLKEAEALRVEVEKNARSVSLFNADLTTEGGCKELASYCIDKLYSIDVLVNNAGGMIKRESLGQMEWKTLEKSFSLNVFSTMYLTSLLTSALKRGKDPSVVNITSIAMRHGAPTATAYGAAKAAIDSFTRGAARELGPDIRVNAIAPGIIDTRFHERVSTPEQMDNWKANTILKKHGKPSDISSAVRFLIDNAFITGETIDINGGLFTR